jgi:undecaprenyl diphosphate synthase
LVLAKIAVISKNMKRITSIPRHVAFIMDGNGRWAEQRGLPRLEGHQAGVKNIRPIIIYLNDHGIEYLTLYAFSTENWNRPDDEVNGLFHMLEDIIDREARELHKNGVRIRHIGQLEGISPGLQNSIKRAVELTRNNTGITLGVALNYGGRAEILEAVRRLMAARVSPQDIDERLFGEYLYTNGFPEVDMVIRTGGEIRTSNFLIWQSAYSEYYFTPVLWPDFKEEDLEKALLTYSQRQRRFGGLQSKATCSGKES